MSRVTEWRGSFGTVLILLVATMLVIAILGEDYYASQIAVVIQAVAILIIYRAADVSRSGFIFAGTIAGFAVLTSLVALGADRETALLISGIAIMALLALGPVVIARKLRDFEHIGAETVYASLCIYLIIGMFFSVLYRVVGIADPQPFFAEAPTPTPMDSIYFSFTTLTTLGYGDLTPAGDIGRMLAITEALIGQVYLVTVVALIVTNLGRKKDRDARHG